MKTTLATLSGAALASAVPQAMAAPAPLRFGANYTPLKNWMYHWQDWDAQSAADDLKAVADLGFDHLRVSCLWPLFQPGPGYISEYAIQSLHSLMESADRAGLDVELAVLSGWMSGSAYMPAWVAPNSKNNIFTSEKAIEGEKLLFARLAKEIGAHKRFLGFDLGNEMSVLVHRGNPLTEQEADTWLDTMYQHLNAIAPGKLHVNGLDHTPWWADFAFSRESCARKGSASTVHSYPQFTGTLQRYGHSGIGTLHLAEYHAELAYAYHTDPARRVWIQEMGANALWMPDSFLEEFVQQAIGNAAETGKLWGLSWWGTFQVDPAIKGFSPNEYIVGVCDRNRQPRLIGKILSKVGQELRGKTFPANQRPMAMVIPDRGLAPKSSDWTWATSFMNLIKAGKKPGIVLESRAKDGDYLRSRGIKELIPFADASKV